MSTPGSAPSSLRRRISTRRQIISGVICLLCFYIYYLFGSGRWMTFQIEGSSMEPTLLAGERVLVDRRLRAPVARGDLVVFHDPRPRYHEDLLIKRVSALPGDQIEVRGGRLYVNGLLEVVPGVIDPVVPDTGDTARTLGDNEVFLLGDNRATSFDSTEFGPLSTDALLGRVTIRIWPLGRLGRVP